MPRLNRKSADQRRKQIKKIKATRKVALLSTTSESQVKAAESDEVVLNKKIAKMQLASPQSMLRLVAPEKLSAETTEVFPNTLGEPTLMLLNAVEIPERSVRGKVSTRAVKKQIRKSFTKRKSEQIKLS